MKRFSDLIILAILWIISIFAIIQVLINSYELGIPNYIGYGLLLAISILRYYKIKRIRIILGVLLIFGSINMIQFTYSTITYTLSWTPLGNRYTSFGFQPLSILLLFFLIVVNFSEILKLFIDLFAEEPNLAIDRENRIVLKHYNELKDEKDTKLQDILDNKTMYQVGYVKTAEKLLNERKLGIKE